MALFDKPDLEKLKRERNYARLIDWAYYTKDPALSRKARELVAADPYDLAQYLYETVEWTKKNSGHSGRRLPRRGISLLRQVSGMAVSIGEPMLAPLADSLRVYGEYGDPELKTKLLYLSVVFDIFMRMGSLSRSTLKALTRDKDPEVSKQAKATLTDLPDEEPEYDEWDEWEDEDAEDDDEDDGEGDVGVRGGDR
jgi:hypothetical protein